MVMVPVPKERHQIWHNNRPMPTPSGPSSCDLQQQVGNAVVAAKTLRQEL